MRCLAREVVTEHVKAAGKKVVDGFLVGGKNTEHWCWLVCFPGDDSPGFGGGEVKVGYGCEDVFVCGFRVSYVADNTREKGGFAGVFYRIGFIQGGSGDSFGAGRFAESFFEVRYGFLRSKQGGFVIVYFKRIEFGLQLD